MPGGGSTIRLPRLVGPQRAMELLTTGRWLNGPEAVEWGLALRSAPLEELDEELEKLVAPPARQEPPRARLDQASDPPGPRPDRARRLGG